MKNTKINDEFTDIIITVGILTMLMVPPLAPLIIFAFVIWIIVDFFNSKKKDLNSKPESTMEDSKKLKSNSFLDELLKSAAEQTLRGIEVGKENKKREDDYFLQDARREKEAKKVFKRKYLRSKAWEQKRQKRFKLDKYCCALCYSEENLECHHITYKNLGHEPLENLRTVCRECHQEIHDTYGYPSQDSFNYLTGWFWKEKDI